MSEEWRSRSFFPSERFPIPGMSSEGATRPIYNHQRMEHSYAYDGVPLAKNTRTDLDFAEENTKLWKANEELKRTMLDYETTITVLMEKGKELDVLNKSNLLDPVKRQILPHSAANQQKATTQTKHVTMVPFEKYNRLKLKYEGLQQKHARMKFCLNAKTPEKSFLDDIATQILQEHLTQKTTEIHRSNQAFALKEKEGREHRAITSAAQGQLKRANSHLNQQISGLELRAANLESQLSSYRSEQQAAKKEELLANSKIARLMEENSQILEKFEQSRREKNVLEETNRILTDQNAVLNEKLGKVTKPQTKPQENVWGLDSQKTLQEMQALMLHRDEQFVQLQQKNALLMQQINILKDQMSAKEELLDEYRRENTKPMIYGN